MAGKLKARVDHRLIHGQVTAGWLHEWDITRIVIIDTPTSRDAFLREVYMMAAPPEIEVSVIAPMEAISILGEREVSTLVLFKDVAHASAAVDEGLDIAELQVGCLPARPGSERICGSVFVDDRDKAMLRRLVQRGIKVFFQTLPKDAPILFDELWREL
ncbi:MAG: PTS sugar transporter subunit IIB [Clostridiales Family XIII bacterium]|nr:PTS sugar transporter subunit IIB [Clostridiales Family XIII bacterium]